MKTMRLNSFAILLIIPFISFSQSFMGLQTDNFGGLHGTIQNPAVLADSRVKWELNLFSLSASLGTDYTNLTLNNVTNFIAQGTFGSLERFPTNNNNILVDANILGPSLQISINEKSGAALYTRIRAVGNFNNINGSLFESIYEGFPLGDFSFEQSDTDFTVHAWGEFGLAYGRTIYKNKKSLLKGGITLKYLLGGGALQGTSEQLIGSYDSNAEQLALNGDLSYSFSTAEAENNPDYFKELSPSFGADFGFIYELRTPKSLASSNADNPRAYNQYKVRFGVSILDIGGINYKGTETSYYDIDATVNARDFEIDPISAIEDQVDSQVSVQNQIWKLPTTLAINVDYSLSHKWFINLNIDRGLVKTKASFNNNPLNLIALTPRYESRTFGAYLPISTSRISGTAAGLGIRLGPLTLGSGSVISNLLGKNAHFTNVFLGFKVPVYHKRKTKDKSSDNKE